MPANVNDLLDRICDRIARRVDDGRLAAARRRCADVMAGREPDYLPMAFGRPGALEDDGGNGWPRFNWAEQWHDPAKSLYMQLIGDLPGVATDSDVLPCVRADTGVINCMTVFGARHVVPEHTKPVISQYVPKEELRAFEVPDDVSGLGVLPRMAEHMAHHLSALRDRGLEGRVDVRHCDQQGPFDIAAQTRGHDLFIDLYEDPPFVHDLMAKCTKVYVAVSKLCKRISGEPLDGGNVYYVWMTNGGVRMCGDSDILVSAGQYEEFIRPYQQEAFSAFGGGWLHYCGGWKGTGRSEGLHLHESYARVEGLRGLNWTTGRDWVAEMRKLAGLGVVHIGTLPREEGEGLRDYLARALSAYDRRWGIVFHADIRPDEADRAMDVWHELQDERFGRRQAAGAMVSDPKSSGRRESPRGPG